ncbi:unnamed protein product [Penicillium olsonii]|nr:unnamed protein product [Penicillium olsonii]
MKLCQPWKASIPSELSRRAGCFLQRDHQSARKSHLDLPTLKTAILPRRQHIFSILTAIKQIAAHPNCPINEIDICSPLEQSDTSRWSKKEQPTASLLGAIQAHTHIHTDYPAICTSTETLSYAELDHITTKWACYLQTRGVGPEYLVPIMMDHSMWAVVAEIAILKAGGAFVPLDPAQRAA